MVMEAKILVFIVFLEVFVFSNLVVAAHYSNGGGSWELLKKNIGISSMHIQLLQNQLLILTLLYI